MTTETTAENYAFQVIDDLADRLPDCDTSLLELYALLALACGTATTLENIHDAWAVWANRTRPDHPSLVPFCQLSPEVQELDRKYAEAVREVAAMAGRSDPHPEPEQPLASPHPVTDYGPARLERVLDIIRNVDRWLDAEVDGAYTAEPLAQDWARVAKCSEEVGEAIEALIAYTGQNPRKGVCGSRDDMLAELADIAVTAMFAIQHFTKDEVQTGQVLMASLEKAAARAAEAGYE